MQLRQRFVRLPFTFDVERLTAEVGAFADHEWRQHPERHAGNSALPLVAVDGDVGNDAVVGRMRRTTYLDRVPYAEQIFAALDTPIGRSRFMRISGNADAKPHVDTNYYWHKRLRIHVPVITTPDVAFLCGDESLHMAPGECWIFDTWSMHNVINPAPNDRIHLVIDTEGSESLWKLIDQMIDGPPIDSQSFRSVTESKFYVIERPGFPAIMPPDDHTMIIAWFEGELERAGTPDSKAVAIVDSAKRFARRWAELYNDRSAAADAERRLARVRFDEELSTFDALIALANGVDAAETLRQLILRTASNEVDGDGDLLRVEPQPTIRQPEEKKAATPMQSNKGPQRINQPVIIVSPPRAGSTLLFETLAKAPGIHTIGGESHAIIESIDALHPRSRDYRSNVLLADDATPEITERLVNAFASAAVDRRGQRPESEPFRLLEKTPKNSLRVLFFDKVFPDAKFLYLYRDPRQQLSSMLDAWRSGRFVTYPGLPGWSGYDWSLVLVPGWRNLAGKTLPEIVVQQWARTTQTLLDSLERIPPARWGVASYDQLLENPQAEIERLCRFLGLEWDQTLGEKLPLAQHTLTEPNPDKWKANWPELEPFVEAVAPVIKRAEDVFGHIANTMQFGRRATDAPPVQPFSSVSTDSVKELLTKTNSSVVMSTYQTNRVITLREELGKLNTHYIALPKPMGIALGPNGRLAVGTQREVVTYRNQVAVARKRTTPKVRDACFIPRGTHVTGDIAIHDMAYSGTELWIVNTRFSALCTLDDDHNFTPRWRPPFVSAFAAEDRCHLNGMTLVDGQPKYVTCLAATDTAGGWRQHKEDGGVIVDVETNQILVEGLSMPHSPRWYNNQLFVLESGKGSIGRVDLANGRVDTIAELPGFTRGLAFLGPYALVGLSQVRESMFGGLPLTRREGERYCGVWIVDLRNGQIAGFLRFEGTVHEIFDVQAMANVSYPEILDLSDETVANAFVVPDELVPQFA